MSLRFGSGWLVIYFLICSCTFICSAPQLRARDYTTFNPFEPLPFFVTPDTRGFGSLDREGAPQAVVAWGLFRIPKGLKCVERREAGRGAGVHAPQAEFTFRTYCRLYGSNPRWHRADPYPEVLGLYRKRDGARRLHEHGVLARFRYNDLKEAAR